jgi:hypothetical protein
MNKTAHYRPLPRRFRRQTLLLVGCGDVGSRIGAQSLASHPADRLRVVGTTPAPRACPPRCARWASCHCQWTWTNVPGCAGSQASPAG